MADRFGHERIPVIGPNLIAPFREHHTDPSAMLRHGFCEAHGDLGLIALGPGIGWVFVTVDLPHAGLAAALATVGATFLTGVLATNLVHRWAHAGTDVHPLVRWLQDRGIVLSPEHHARHHAGTCDRAYCITTGWMNPLLERVCFFPLLERLLRGLLPASWSELS
jgi:ubiquitin-conjugating enzyme E2 variant